MKRLILLGILAAALLGVAATASAADIKATGQWIVEAIWSDNFDFVSDANNNQRSNLNQNEEKFNIWTRVRTQFEFIANENLKGVLATEVGSNKWGASGTYDVGSTPVAIGVRRAYVDFNWPGTKVNFKAGPMIGVSLPSAVGGGSAIFDEEVSSLVVSAPITDNVSVLGVYARLFSGTGTYGAASAGYHHDTMDAFALALPLKFDGFKVTPFGMFAYAENGIFTRGNNVTAHTLGLLAQNASTSQEQGIQSWWGGAAIEMTMFDPFVVKADVNYGSLTTRSTANGAKQNNMSGWMCDLTVDYTGLSFMTPQLFFAYTTGEEGNATTHEGASHRMPMVVASSYSLGSFWMGGASGKMLAGSTNIGTARSNLAASMGFWTVGLNLKDITFLEGLKHTFTVMYVQGTNNKDIGAAYTVAGATGQTSVNNIQYGQTLTTKDSLWEIDLNTKYAIYKELTAYLELGYIAPSFSKSVWGDSNGGDAATKVAVGLGYNF